VLKFELRGETQLSSAYLSTIIGILGVQTGIDSSKLRVFQNNGFMSTVKLSLLVALSHHVHESDVVGHRPHALHVKKTCV